MVNNSNIDTEIPPNIKNHSHKIFLICTQQAQKNFKISIFRVLQIQYFSVFLLYVSGGLLLFLQFFFFENNPLLSGYKLK